MNTTGDIFTAVENLDKLALKEADVELEAVTLPYLDEEEMMIVLLSLLVGGVLSEECLTYLFEVTERM